VVLDGNIVSPQRLHRLAVGDGEYPRRKLALSFESRGALPHYQQGVVQDLLGKLRLPYQLGDEPPQPGPVAAIELVERLPVTLAYPRDQPQIGIVLVPPARRLFVATRRYQSVVAFVFERRLVRPAPPTVQSTYPSWSAASTVIV
jgi:hypothetical protein